MLRLPAKKAAGFTMIEVMVTLSIFAILAAVAVPAMQVWIANNKVRAVADALQTGMRLAETESLRRSRQVVFGLTNSTSPQTDFTSGALTAANSGNSWVITTVPVVTDGSDPSAFVGSGLLTSAGSSVAIAGPAEVCFNSVGRLVTNGSTSLAGGTCAPVNAGAPQYIYYITLAHAHGLNVYLSLGGQVHMCDPSQTLSASNPYGC